MDRNDAPIGSHAAGSGRRSSTSTFGLIAGALAIVVIGFAFTIGIEDFLPGSGPNRVSPADLETLLGSGLPGATDVAPLIRDPGSVVVSQRILSDAEIAFPTGAASSSSPGTTVTAKGTMTSTLYLAGTGRLTAQIYSALSKALTDSGFTNVFVCGGDGCGGGFRGGYVRNRGPADLIFGLFRKPGSRGDTLLALTVGRTGYLVEVVEPRAAQSR